MVLIKYADYVLFVPFMVDRFDHFKISPLSIKALHEVAGFDTMTVVQDATLPVILKGM